MFCIRQALQLTSRVEEIIPFDSVKREIHDE